MDNYKPIHGIRLSTNTPVQRNEVIEPRYNGKKIIMWGEIVSDCGMGFNILLLDEGDSYYGKNIL